MIPDAFLTPLWLIEHDRTSYSLTAIDLIDTRARYLGLESVVIGDEYLFFRDAYLQSREFEINDGVVEDDFDDFDDFEDLKISKTLINSFFISSFILIKSEWLM